MLQYEKIDVSKEIDVNKTVLSKNACFVIIGTLNMLDLSLNDMFVNVTNAYELKNIAILNVKGVNLCVFCGVLVEEIFQKAKERYSKEKAAEYYLQNKQAIKEKSKNRYKNLSEEEKDRNKEYQRQRYQQLIQYKKEALQNK